jgi:hypothetical protein
MGPRAIRNDITQPLRTIIKQFVLVMIFFIGDVTAKYCETLMQTIIDVLAKAKNRFRKPLN